MDGAETVHGFKFSRIVPVLIFLNILFLLETTRAQGVRGTIATCTNEGEEVEVPLITDDPCIKCFCESGEVKCRQNSCQKLKGCYYVLFEKPPKECCDVCKGCMFNGKTLESGDMFTEKGDVCMSYRCWSGVITRSEIRCHVPCRNPIERNNQCCPSCKGCSYEGKKYKNGDSFNLATDPCVECTCKKGSVSCSKRACPVVNCPSKYMHTPEGECCKSCKGMRRVYDIKTGPCFFRNKVFRNGVSFKPEKCTDCSCVNGTVICKSETCPVLDCVEEDQFHPEGTCCKRCIPRRTCTYQKEIYKHREEWRPDICTHCSCFDGTTHCQREQCKNSLWCPKGYKLEYHPDKCCPKCVEYDAVCTVFGDPHYKTFDGKMYNYQGACKYLLTKDCTKKREFSIKVQNNARMTSNFAWTQMFVIKLNDTKISFHQGLVIKVNKKKVKLPFSYNSLFSLKKDGHSVFFKSSIGLQVIWDGNSFVEVTLSRRFKHKTCGLCGNYNGRESDEFVGRDRVQHLNTKTFGDTWIVGSQKRCDLKAKPLAESPCKTDPRAQRRAKRKCRILIKGPLFSKCRRNIDAFEYYHSCVTDMCDCPKRKKCFCESITAFIRACERQGYSQDWPRYIRCPAVVTCPDGASYSKCATGCPVTCTNAETIHNCRKICSPGCECPVGKVLHNKRCIEPTDCPK